MENKTAFPSCFNTLSKIEAQKLVVTTLQNIEPHRQNIFYVCHMTLQSEHLDWGWGVIGSLFGISDLDRGLYTNGKFSKLKCSQQNLFSPTPTHPRTPWKANVAFCPLGLPMIIQY